MVENFFGVLTEELQPSPLLRPSADPLTGNNIVDVSVPLIIPYKGIQGGLVFWIPGRGFWI